MVDSPGSMSRGKSSFASGEEARVGSSGEEADEASSSKKVFPKSPECLLREETPCLFRIPGKTVPKTKRRYPFSSCLGNALLLKAAKFISGYSIFRAWAVLRNSVFICSIFLASSGEEPRALVFAGGDKPVGVRSGLKPLSVISGNFTMPVNFSGDEDNTSGICGIASGEEAPVAKLTFRCKFSIIFHSYCPNGSMPLIYFSGNPPGTFITLSSWSTGLGFSIL